MSNNGGNEDETRVKGRPHVIYREHSNISSSGMAVVVQPESPGREGAAAMPYPYLQQNAVRSQPVFSGTIGRTMATKHPATSQPALKTTTSPPPVAVLSATPSASALVGRQPSSTLAQRKSVPPPGNTTSGSTSNGSMDDDAKTAAEILALNNRISRMDRFKTVLEQTNIDLERLRKLSWNGCPDEHRATVWRLLMGYLPTNSDRRAAVLAKKRNDYAEYVAQSYAKGQAGLDHAIWHQIHIDIPRTHPGLKLYQHPVIQKSLERILYCWAIRHPASGYVQGINDLVTPFYQVFLSSHLNTDDLERYDIDKVAGDVIQSVEADSFWCLSKLLDGIQDNYTHAQPGIQRQLQKMKELVGRIDGQSIEFLQFAFRWMNCLLMREMSIHNVIRMWDTYLAEGPDGFSDFHTYVCAAFLVKFSEPIRQREFQDIMIYLQSLPTKDWGEKEIEVLLSEAYMWKSLFHNAPSHLVGAATPAKNNWSI